MDRVKRDILIAKADIDKRVQELADVISRDYEGKELVVIGILKGAFVFMADLIRSLRVPCMIDFVRLASYGTGTVSSGSIMITKDIETPIRGRDVLVVEDIVDTGLSIDFIKRLVALHNPKSFEVVTLLYKKESIRIPTPIKYIGFNIPSDFVIGYGLDYAQKVRNLPAVYHMIKH